jgi:hypothetical protein
VKKSDKIVDVVWVEIDPAEMVSRVKWMALAKISVKLRSDEICHALEFNGQTINDYHQFKG